LGKGAKKLNSFSLEEAKKLIDEYYEYAKKQEYIQRPLAWAMYKAWQKVNEYGEKGK
jgi:galactose-1-phosphate uridylyltransferase